MCNTSKGEKYGSDSVTSKKKAKKKKGNALISTDKLKKKGEGFFKKLKNFGGKNIGEAG